MGALRENRRRSRGVPPFLIAVLGLGALAWIATRPVPPGALPAGPSPGPTGPAAAKAPTAAKGPASAKAPAAEEAAARDREAARKLIAFARERLARGDLEAARDAARRAREAAGSALPELDELLARIRYHAEMREALGKARERSRALRGEGRLGEAIDIFKQLLFAYPLIPDRPKIEEAIASLEKERAGRFATDMEKLRILAEGGAKEEARRLLAGIAVYAGREELRAARTRARELGVLAPPEGSAKAVESTPATAPAEKEPGEAPSTAKGTGPAAEEAPPSPEEAAAPPDAARVEGEIRAYLAALAGAHRKPIPDMTLEGEVTLVPDALAERVAREALAALEAGVPLEELGARVRKAIGGADRYLRDRPLVEIRIPANPDRGLFLTGGLDDHIAVRQRGLVPVRIEPEGPAPRGATWRIVERRPGAAVAEGKLRLAWLEEGLAVRLRPRPKLRDDHFLEINLRDLLVCPRMAPGRRGFLPSTRWIPAEALRRIPEIRIVFEASALRTAPEPPAILRPILGE